jgi:hypothetical protein
MKASEAFMRPVIKDRLRSSGGWREQHLVSDRLRSRFIGGEDDVPYFPEDEDDVTHLLI